MLGEFVHGWMYGLLVTEVLVIDAFLLRRCSPLMTLS